LFASEYPEWFDGTTGAPPTPVWWQTRHWVRPAWSAGISGAPAPVGADVGAAVGGAEVGATVGGTEVGAVVGGTDVGALVGGTDVGALVGGTDVGAAVGAAVAPQAAINAAISTTLMTRNRV
jgi:hypothetical protein